MRVLTAFVAFNSLVSALVLQPRADNAAAIIKDFNAAIAENKQLLATVNSFADDAKSIPVSTQGKLLKESSAIKKDIESATKEASSSSDFSDSDSSKIAKVIIGGENPTEATLKAIVAHKVAFKNSDTTSIVVNNLKGIESAIEAFSKAVTPKLSSTYQKQAPAVTKKYVADFNKAIKGVQ